MRLLRGLDVQPPSRLLDRQLEHLLERLGDELLRLEPAHEGAAAVACPEQVAACDAVDDAEERDERHARVAELAHREPEVRDLAGVVGAIVGQHVPEVVLVAQPVRDVAAVRVQLEARVRVDARGLRVHQAARGDPPPVHELQVRAPEAALGHRLEARAIGEDRHEVRALTQKALTVRRAHERLVRALERAARQRRDDREDVVGAPGVLREAHERLERELPVDPVVRQRVQRGAHGDII